MNKIDCIAFGPHPDDVELFCSGTLVKLKTLGYRTAIIDLTRGELSTNGDVDSRQREAEQAAGILNLDERINLSIPDGNIENIEENRGKIIEVIRKFTPELCFIPYWIDRHPDHVDASNLIQKAIFESGLSKIEGFGKAHRPGTTLFYMLHNEFKPSFIVDISAEKEIKNKAIAAYATQFSQTGPGIKPTYINQSNFLDYLNSREEYLGHQIRAGFGEGFYYEGSIKIDNPIESFK